MTKLTFEEMTAAMVIMKLTSNNSQKTLDDVNDFLENDIDMGKVCRWLKENNYAQVAYEKHGNGCVINIGAQLMSGADAMLKKEF